MNTQDPQNYMYCIEAFLEDFTPEDYINNIKSETGKSIVKKVLIDKDLKHTSIQDMVYINTICQQMVDTTNNVPSIDLNCDLFEF